MEAAGFERPGGAESVVEGAATETALGVADVRQTGAMVACFRAPSVITLCSCACSARSEESSVAQVGRRFCDELLRSLFSFVKFKRAAT